MNKEKYFTYLDQLRESGSTNMFGAIPYLLKKFPELSEGEGRNIFSEWMETFTERHPLKN